MSKVIFSMASGAGRSGVRDPALPRGPAAQQGRVAGAAGRARAA